VSYCAGSLVAGDVLFVRAAIFSASSGNGRCSALLARIQTSRSSSVVRIEWLIRLQALRARPRRRRIQRRVLRLEVTGPEVNRVRSSFQHFATILDKTVETIEFV
jgi:hypothetical protein